MIAGLCSFWYVLNFGSIFDFFHFSVPHSFISVWFFVFETSLLFTSQIIFVNSILFLDFVLNLFIFSSFFHQFSLFQNYFISLFSLSFLLSIIHWENVFQLNCCQFLFWIMKLQMWCVLFFFLFFFFSFNCCLGDFIFAFVFLSWMPACSLKLSKFLGFGKAAVHVHAFWIAKCNMTKMNFVFQQWCWWCSSTVLYW